MTPSPSPRPLTSEERRLIEACKNTPPIHYAGNESVPAFPVIRRLLEALDAERQRAERVEKAAADVLRESSYACTHLTSRASRERYRRWTAAARRLRIVIARRPAPAGGR